MHDESEYIRLELEATLGGSWIVDYKESQNEPYLAKRQWSVSSKSFNDDNAPALADVEKCIDAGERKYAIEEDKILKLI